MKRLVLIAHNLRSSHNVGSLLRTCDGLGVEKVYLSGYTPYPLVNGDERLPHLAQRINKQIVKTALGAESTQTWGHVADITALVMQLKSDGFFVAALEQSNTATTLNHIVERDKVALIVGREVEGIEDAVIATADATVEIPMLGHKESHNVTQAAAMALYHLRFYEQ